MKSLKLSIFRGCFLVAGALGVLACGRGPSPSEGGVRSPDATNTIPAGKGPDTGEPRAPSGGSAEVSGTSAPETKAPETAPASSASNQKRELTPEERERSNWALAESFYRFDSPCSKPWIAFVVPNEAAPSEGRYLARLLAEFPELDRGLREKKGTALQRATVSEGGDYDLPYYRKGSGVVARCSTSEECAHLAWIVAVATAQKPVTGCGEVTGWRVGDELALPSSFSSALSDGEACARERLCAAKTRGQIWECASFPKTDLARCAQEATCAAVQTCFEKIDWKDSKRLHPQPSPRPPGL